MARIALILMTIFFGILLLIIIFSNSSVMHRNREIELTGHEMTEVEAAMRLYKQLYGHLPPSTTNAELTAAIANSKIIGPGIYFPPECINASGELVDGWGVPLILRQNGPNEFTLTSAGRDQKWSTPDDLSHSFYP